MTVWHTSTGVYFFQRLRAQAARIFANTPVKGRDFTDSIPAVSGFVVPFHHVIRRLYNFGKSVENLKRLADPFVTIDASVYCEKIS
jgi:hypothetical protein